MKSYQRHELSDLFRAMTDEEFNSLVASMKRNGFRPQCPITLWDDGSGAKIVDGWHRSKAAVVAEVEPLYTTFQGTQDEVIQLIYDLNAVRRHLTSAQQIQVLLERDNYKEVTLPEITPSPQETPLDAKKRTATQKRAKERAAKEISAKTKVSPSKVKKHIELKQERPELAKLVKDGHITESKAFKIAGKEDPNNQNTLDGIDPESHGNKQHAINLKFKQSDLDRIDVARYGTHESQPEFMHRGVLELVERREKGLDPLQDDSQAQS